MALFQNRPPSPNTRTNRSCCPPHPRSTAPPPPTRSTSRCSTSRSSSSTSSASRGDRAAEARSRGAQPQAARVRRGPPRDRRETHARARPARARGIRGEARTRADQDCPADSFARASRPDREPQPRRMGHRGAAERAGPRRLPASTRPRGFTASRVRAWSPCARPRKGQAAEDIPSDLIPDSGTYEKSFGAMVREGLRLLAAHSHRRRLRPHCLPDPAPLILRAIA